MIVVGIDVASKVHVVYGVPGCTQIQNNTKGIREFLKGVPKDAVIALESTGGYGLELAEMACKMGFTVYMLSGKQVKHYRISLGRRAKTDTLDAKLIAEFVERDIEHLRPYKPWPKDLKKLRDLVRTRTRLAQDRARIRQRLRALALAKANRDLAVGGLDKTIRKLEVQIAQMLKEFECAPALRSCPGVGPITSAGLTAAIEHFQPSNADALVALIGLDLVVDESSTIKGKKRVTKTGDCTLRHLAYVCAASASRTKAWKADYEALLAKGLKRPQALCALARKMIRVIYHLYTTNTFFCLETRSKRQNRSATPMA